MIVESFKFVLIAASSSFSFSSSLIRCLRYSFPFSVLIDMFQKVLVGSDRFDKLNEKLLNWF